jgi:hypothetical protein
VRLIHSHVGDTPVLQPLLAHRLKQVNHLGVHATEVEEVLRVCRGAGSGGGGRGGGPKHTEAKYEITPKTLYRGTRGRHHTPQTQTQTMKPRTTCARLHTSFLMKYRSQSSSAGQREQPMGPRGEVPRGSEGGMIGSRVRAPSLHPSSALSC